MKKFTLLLANLLIVSLLFGQDNRKLHPAQIFNVGGALISPLKKVPEIQNGYSVGTSLAYFIGLNGQISREDWDDQTLKPYIGPAFSYIYSRGNSITINNSNQYEINSAFHAKSYYIGLQSRIEIGSGLIHPFVDGGIGALIINWNHNISIQDSTQKNEATLDLGSTGFLYGAGGGILIDWGYVALEFRVAYKNSQKIQLMDINTVEVTGNNSISYQKKNLNTDMLLFYLGLSIDLN